MWKIISLININFEHCLWHSSTLIISEYLTTIYLILSLWSREVTWRHLCCGVGLDNDCLAYRPQSLSHPMLTYQQSVFHENISCSGLKRRLFPITKRIRFHIHKMREIEIIQASGERPLSVRICVHVQKIYPWDKHPLPLAWGKTPMRVGVLFYSFVSWYLATDLLLLWQLYIYIYSIYIYIMSGNVGNFVNRILGQYTWYNSGNLRAMFSNMASSIVMPMCVASLTLIITGSVSWHFATHEAVRRVLSSTDRVKISVKEAIQNRFLFLSHTWNANTAT